MNELSRASVLIVDDSSTMRALLRDMLTRLGVRHIAEAADGRSAIAMIRATSYTVIISDWHMEPVDGLELLRACRRLSRPGFNRFVFSTSEKSWGSQTTAKVEGAEAFIIKPFTVEDLRAKLNQVLAR